VIEDLSHHATEQRNPNSHELDQMSALEIVSLMSREDHMVMSAVDVALPALARLVEGCAERMSDGGRLFYVGAGTSGRLGMLDAAECPPTFGTPPELVQAVLAGGPQAFLKAVEHAEDDPEAGAAELRSRGLNARDIVVGISASGRTPFVLGALQAARQLGALTASIYCNAAGALGQAAEIPVLLAVGPEVLTGSTRLKAGTATKIALNMITTGTMVRMGKVLGNMMVDLTPTCKKLVQRSVRILAESSGLSWDVAEGLLAAADGDLRVATVMAKGGVALPEARSLLEGSGSVREALQRVKG